MPAGLRQPRSPEARPRRKLTPGQRWRLRRDLAVYTAHREGCPKAILADAHNLSQRQITRIIDNLKASHGQG